jgi:hypothetical protein
MGAPPIRSWLANQKVAFLGSAVLAIGTLGGPLLTAFAPIEEATWWLWPCVRVGFLAVGVSLIAAHLATYLEGRTRRGAFGVCALVLLALGHAPLGDLLSGPEPVAGTLEVLRFDRARKRLYATLTVRQPSGRWSLEPAGAEASKLRAEVARQGCQRGDHVELLALPALERIIRFRCDASLER